MALLPLLASAAPRADGYTLVIGNWNTQVANGVIYSQQNDIVKDFEPVMLLPSAPMVLIAKKALPATDLKEFIAWLKANPDKATFGTAGVGSPPHMLALMFRQQTGTQFQMIPYRGAGPAMQDVVAGQIDATFITVGPALPQITFGRRQSLSASRPISAWRLLLDIPTMDEAGLPHFYFSYWSGLYAPRGTPKDDHQGCRRRRRRGHARSARSAEKLETQAFVIPPRPISKRRKRWQRCSSAEVAKWGPIIKEAGIKAD